MKFNYRFCVLALAVFGIQIVQANAGIADAAKQAAEIAKCLKDAQFENILVSVDLKTLDYTIASNGKNLAGASINSIDIYNSEGRMTPSGHGCSFEGKSDKVDNNFSFLSKYALRMLKGGTLPAMTLPFSCLSISNVKFKDDFTRIFGEVTKHIPDIGGIFKAPLAEPSGEAKAGTAD